MQEHEVNHEQPATAAVATRRERKVYAGMWGRLEIAVVAFGIVALTLTILYYMFVVIPAQRQLSANQAKVAELDKKLKEANTRWGSITTSKERVGELITSADDFQMRLLSARGSGEPLLYQNISALIKAYGLLNSAGPDYAPLETVDLNRQEQKPEEGKGRARMVSYYPGTYVTMTVEGSYVNLRRFIRELETMNQFVVINNVELEPSENADRDKKEAEKNAQPQPTVAPVMQPGFGAVQPGFNEPAEKVDRGKMRGQTVTLRIELAAYFRRPDFAPASVAETQVP